MALFRHGKQKKVRFPFPPIIIWEPCTNVIQSYIHYIYLNIMYLKMSQKYKF